MHTASLSLRRDNEPLLVDASNLLKPSSLPTKKEQLKDNVVYEKIRNICCIGAGYVGGPTCSVIASKNPDVKVTIVDLSEKRIQAWQTDDLPIHEPNLLAIVQSARDQLDDSRPPNLFFSTDIDAAILEADLIFVSVNTPTKTFGHGKGRQSELSFVESAIRRIAAVAENDKIIVEKSTVPVRTAESMREILLANCKPGVHFEILSNPEFLAEGTAVKNLLFPDRILVGSLNTTRGMRAAAALVGIYSSWVPREKIITTNLWSSELAKLAANVLLAQRISSINALSAICEVTGADVSEISYACGLDSRIGPKMLSASVGFGGSCLKKDILSLSYIAESLHLPEVASYWRSINEINEYQKDRFTRRIISCLHHSLMHKKIAILGFAFKKDTGDTRESAAISIVCDLVAEGASIGIYDPRASEENIWFELEAACDNPKLMRERVTIFSTVYEACIDAHAAVIVTEWDYFSNEASRDISHRVDKLWTRDELALPFSPPQTPCVEEQDPTKAGGVASSNTRPRMNWESVAGVMKKPMYVFDGRDIVDAGKLQELGFRVEGIGRPGTGKKVLVDLE